MSQPAQTGTPAEADHKQSSRAVQLVVYGLSFAFSLVAALLLVFFSRIALIDTMPGNSLAGDFGDFVKQVTAGWDCVLSDKCGKVSGHEAKSHAVTVSSGIVQIVGVIAITFLWFYAFVLSRWWFRAIALVPTFIYVWGMFNAYQPAVLVAALAAIFVAAEHYKSLQEHGQQLDKHGEELTASKDALNDTRVELEGILADVKHIKNSTQLSLTKAGLDIFTQEVYGAYSRARTVYGVLRDHKIERDWWSCAEQEFKKGNSLDQVWDWYQAPVAVPPGIKQRLTLFSSLTQKRNDTLQDAGVESAYFVSSMQMPGSAQWEACDKATLFEDLLGLAWECVVLERVRKKLQKSESIGEWVSRPLCWALATDKEVWQVIKRRTLDDSIVIKTADALDNLLDGDLSNKIIESTQAELRSYLRRGMTAEEYLCAVLFYPHDQDPDAHLHAASARIAYNNIRFRLLGLHMLEWLKPKQDPAIQEQICVAIFRELIDLRGNRPISSDLQSRPPSSQLLAQEVL